MEHPHFQRFAGSNADGVFHECHRRHSPGSAFGRVRRKQHFGAHRQCKRNRQMGQLTSRACRAAMQASISSLPTKLPITLTTSIISPPPTFPRLIATLRAAAPTAAQAVLTLEVPMQLSMQIIIKRRCG